MCSTLIIGPRYSACLVPVNCSCLTAFVGLEANLLMHLQEPPRGDGAYSSVNFLNDCNEDDDAQRKLAQYTKDICKSSRALSKINSNSFSQDLQQSGLHSADTTGDVDKLWKDWHAKVTNVLDKHAPLRQRHNRRRRHRLCPWSTPALRHLVHRQISPPSCLFRWFFMYCCLL